ncbi:unnamed protein product [Fraxinus pennsylvanica]|uniref:Uncharacterized protein n=1 Tax=Fraxinus pennsylvanica TaxID=56036 RepID=A0AAD2E671_9LAMI|nr:unnamed protein product [Fraxinus pennsylvanica]
MKASFREFSSSSDISGSTATSSQPKNDLENGDSMLNNTFVDWLHNIDRSLVCKVLAEMLGTFVLMFCICAIIAIMHLIGVEVGLMEYAATEALTVTVIVFSIRAISGTHFNPAVTIAFATVGPFPWSKVPLYILAQIVGSALATYIERLVYGLDQSL